MTRSCRECGRVYEHWSDLAELDEEAQLEIEIKAIKARIQQKGATLREGIFVKKKMAADLLGLKSTRSLERRASHRKLNPRKFSGENHFSIHEIAHARLLERKKSAS